MGISVKELEQGQELHIRISGRFDFSTHQAFRDAYASVRPEATRFTIDFTETEYMDSAALGMLLMLRERAGGPQSDITLTGFNPAIGQILQVSRFENLFKLERNRAA